MARMRQMEKLTATNRTVTATSTDAPNRILKSAETDRLAAATVNKHPIGRRRGVRVSEAFIVYIVGVTVKPRNISTLSRMAAEEQD
jgi:hypothetical protein